jgi:hypothetical protein
MDLKKRLGIYDKRSPWFVGVEFKLRTEYGNKHPWRQTGLRRTWFATRLEIGSFRVFIMYKLCSSSSPLEIEFPSLGKRMGWERAFSDYGPRQQRVDSLVDRVPMLWYGYYSLYTL